MKQLGNILRFLVAEFGPLIVFWLVLAAFGLKPAIATTIVFVLADALRHYWRGIPFTRVYLLSAVLVVIFGGVDLVATSPFMLQYEAVITNVATGLVFVAGAMGAKPMIQEIAEQREGTVYPNRPDIHRFFQLFTLFWASYFFLKAGAYLWLAATMPLQRAMMVRSIAGGLSLGLMIAVSSQGRRAFFLCRALGILPASEAEPPAAVQPSSEPSA